MKHFLEAQQGTDGRLTVRHNLHHDPACCRDRLLESLIADLGYEPVRLQKAVPRALDFDPRFPEFVGLVRAARREWHLYGKRLVDEVARRLEGGTLLPLDDDTRAGLEELFRTHRTSLVVRFAGDASDLARMRELVDLGLVDPHFKVGLVGTSYRLGRALDLLQPEGGTTPRKEHMSEIVRRALHVDLTEEDHAALRYVQQKAQLYTDAAARKFAGVLEVAVLDADRARTRSALGRAIQEGQSAGQLAAELRRSVAHIINEGRDMDRVARTELVNARNEGAAVTLERTAHAAGIADPFVYKLARAGACAHCRRIWGHPEPIPYRLSEVRKRDASGGNRGLPARDWGPVTGAVHPNCTEGPLLHYNPEIRTALAATLARLPGASP